MPGSGSSAPADNPLLGAAFPVPFDRIEPAHVGPAVAQTLASATEQIEDLASGRTDVSNPLQALEEITCQVERVWAPISHLNNVNSTSAFREEYATALPDVARFQSRLFQHSGLYRALKDFAASPQGQSSRGISRRHLQRTLTDFRRAGAELSASEKAEMEVAQVEISELGQKFAENVLEETATYGKSIHRVEKLAGLPKSTVERAKQLAQARDEEGWLLTLDMPAVQAVLRYAEARALREEIHTAYLERCTRGEHDNRPLIARLLELRHKLARLLGHADYPDYRLETLMARSGDRVASFLDDLTERTRPFYERDIDQVEARAKNEGYDTLQPWDVAYLTEQIRQEVFGLDEEALRPWFPLAEVQAGLFEIAKRLFGMSVEDVDNPAVWHPEVRYYEVHDESGTHLGSFYTDWFPRETKRDGAWMDVFVSGGPSASGFCPHLAFIGGNFNPPTGNCPSLLTHREVCTLFHEFGHLLHQMASRVEIPSRGGVNVAWDWVEVPSQLLENWCWEPSALDLFARNYDTGEPLPPEELRRLLAARCFMGGWNQMRQLSLATLDQKLHREYDGGEPVEEFAATTLRPFVPHGRFVARHLLTTFSHLFGGGYASAYYSYMWSETLEADIFSRFAELGVLNPDAGRAFLEKVLSQGDRHDPERLFREFMGREPDPGALIRRNLEGCAGISAGVGLRGPDSD